MGNTVVTLGTTSFVGENWGGAFDAVLSRSEGATVRYKLTINLRIALVQKNVTPPFVMDLKEKAFMTRPWSARDWNNFISGAQQQADMWNNRFWLKPPSFVKEYDRINVATKRTERPYIGCELQVSFVQPKIAHKTIEVVNLETANIRGSKNSGTFAGHSLLWDSLDSVPWVMNIPDDKGAINGFQHFSIAHEIGHALGLRHIGVMLKTKLCEDAIDMATSGGDKDLGEDLKHYKGGTASDYCYGWGQPKSVAENIMGYGASFTDENARPWIWSITRMRNAPWEGWQALTVYAGDWFPVA
jgi:hypothetical protein